MPNPGLNFVDIYNKGARYFTDEGGANVTKGSIQVFTCKHGFKPYFNAIVAAQLEDYKPRPGNEFFCTCQVGKWICTSSCRCEGYCDESL